MVEGRTLGGANEAAEVQPTFRGIARVAPIGGSRQGDQMKRRLLLAGVAAPLLWTARARSDQPRRLAILLAVGPTSEYTASIAALEQAMATRGWRKGETLAIDLYLSTGDPQRRREAIAAILAASPDVVLTQSEAVTASVMQAGGTFPVVFVHVADPVGPGLVGGPAGPAVK